MKKKMRRFILAGVISLFLGANSAWAILIDFEDTIGPVGPIQGELTWINALGVDVSQLDPPHLYQGYYSTLTSGKYVGAAAITTDPVVVTGTTLFNFENVVLGTDVFENSTLEIMGFEGANMLYYNSFEIGCYQSTYFQASVVGTDTMVFMVHGGTAILPAVNPRLVFDDFNYSPASAPIPEPATCLLLGIGLLGISGINKLKKRA